MGRFDGIGGDVGVVYGRFFSIIRAFNLSRTIGRSGGDNFSVGLR